MDISSLEFAQGCQPALVTMPLVSVIMPVFNVERYVGEAISSVLAQSYARFELLIVDDGATDRSVQICEQFSDHRITIIRREHRGLAATRNAGLRISRGEYVAFIDGDDTWAPTKLERHAAHFMRRPFVGMSYSCAAYIDETGRPLGIYQVPKLRNITARDVFVDNPIRNGSNAVIRRRVFDDISSHLQAGKGLENSYFDESLKRSEDHECWIRIACTTHWQFEGLPQILVNYRTNPAGLSADLQMQYDSWGEKIERVRSYSPELVAAYMSLAEAYELRYMAQRSIMLHRDGGRACDMIALALRRDCRILTEQPLQSLLTLGAAHLLKGLPRFFYSPLELVAEKLFGSLQRLVLLCNRRARLFRNRAG